MNDHLEAYLQTVRRRVMVHYGLDPCPRLQPPWRGPPGTGVTTAAPEDGGEPPAAGLALEVVLGPGGILVNILRAL